MNNYEKSRSATETILQFMGELNRHYDARTMRQLQSAEDEMEHRWGIFYMADCIRTDRQGTELALVRFAQEHPAADPAPAPAPKKRRKPKFRQRKPYWIKPVITGFLLGLAAVAIFAIVLSHDQIGRSEELLAHSVEVSEP